MKNTNLSSDQLMTDAELDATVGGGFDPVYDIMLGYRSRLGQPGWEQTPWQDNKNTF